MLPKENIFTRYPNSVWSVHHLRKEFQIFEYVKSDIIFRENSASPGISFLF